MKYTLQDLRKCINKEYNFSVVWTMNFQMMGRMRILQLENSVCQSISSQFDKNCAKACFEKESVHAQGHKLNDLN